MTVSNRHSESAAARIYRALLRAYPADFRSEYERELALAFRDMRRDAENHGVQFWMRIAHDIAQSAPPLRIAAWRMKEPITNWLMEAIMKIAALFAVLFGVFGAVNAIVEGVAGSPAAPHMTSVVLGVAGGVLLITAGVLMLRRSPTGKQTIGVILVASLVVVITARFVQPWMSMFSLLAGIALPLLLLASLRFTRSSQSTA